jgi:hypothetical protein
MRKVTFRYSKTSEPSAAKVRKALQKAVQQVSVPESVQALVQQLTQFEARFGMSTVEFYTKYLAGAMGDGEAVMEWAGAYEEYMYLVQQYGHRAAQSR